MTFEKKRVYSCINAEDLEIGSKVIVANNLEDLKKRVAEYKPENTIHVIRSIKPEMFEYRFMVDEGYANDGYMLAYLVELPNENALKWTDLKVGDTIRDRTDKNLLFMITAMDTTETDDEDFCHVMFANEWTSDKELEGYEKVTIYDV